MAKESFISIIFAGEVKYFASLNAIAPSKAEHEAFSLKEFF